MSNSMTGIKLTRYSLFGIKVWEKYTFVDTDVLDGLVTLMRRRP